MSKELILKKNMDVDDSDPKSIAQHAQDPAGSFLSMYRSFDTNYEEKDEQFVTKAMNAGVTPESLKYAVMRRGSMEAYRGIVKSVDGNTFYFSWSPGTQIRFVPATTRDQLVQAAELYGACKLGCVKKADSAVLDTGESVSEATEADNDDSEVKKTAQLPGAASMPVEEQQSINEQHTLATRVHPGSTGASMPDDNTIGQDWHGQQQQQSPFGKASDFTNNNTSADPQWNASLLLKAWGEKLRESTPVLRKPLSKLETRYLQEVLKTGEATKGVPARNIKSYEQWRAGQLSKSLGSLRSWLGKHE